MKTICIPINHKEYKITLNNSANQDEHFEQEQYIKDYIDTLNTDQDDKIKHLLYKYINISIENMKLKNEIKSIYNKIQSQNIEAS